MFGFSKTRSLLRICLYKPPTHKPQTLVRVCMVARASVGHLSLAIALALALAPCALAGNPCTCKTCLDSTGEAVCQGHGYSESECLALGDSCCQWDPDTNPADLGWPSAPGTSTGACWSAIGDSPCPRFYCKSTDKCISPCKWVGTSGTLNRTDCLCAGPTDHVTKDLSPSAYYLLDLQYVGEYQRCLRSSTFPSTIVGQAYMQMGGIGRASYHFPEIEQAYISWEDTPAVNQAGWTLDNGQPLPSRKTFANPQYDEATRTFTGTLIWGNTPLNGWDRVEYEMVFSSDFVSIAGGQVTGC